MPPTRHTVDEILAARPAWWLRVFCRAVDATILFSLGNWLKQRPTQ